MQRAQSAEKAKSLSNVAIKKLTEHVRGISKKLLHFLSIKAIYTLRRVYMLDDEINPSLVQLLDYLPAEGTL